MRWTLSCLGTPWQTYQKNVTGSGQAGKRWAQGSLQDACTQFAHIP